MPRPKRPTILTHASANTAAAIDEYRTGIEHFLTWANLARTGETSRPGAFQLDEALRAFSEGRFDEKFIGLSEWAVAAGSRTRDTQFGPLTADGTSPLEQSSRTWAIAHVFEGAQPGFPDACPDALGPPSRRRSPIPGSPRTDGSAGTRWNPCSRG